MLEDIDAKRALNLFLKHEEFQFEAYKKKVVKEKSKPRNTAESTGRFPVSLVNYY